MGTFEEFSNEEKKRFGKRLKERRKQVGISTQEKFAERLDCHVKTVKNWEQGQSMPELSTLVKICRMLQCSIDYLLGNIDETTHDIHFISHETGLTEKSVRGIQAQWLKCRTKEEIISFDGLAVKRDGVQEGGYVPVQYADALTSIDSLRDFWKVYGLYSEIGRDDPAGYVERLISEKQIRSRALAALNALLSHPAGMTLLENLWAYLNFEYEPTPEEIERASVCNERNGTNYKSVIKGKGGYIDSEYLNRAFLISMQHNCITLKNEVGRANDNGVKGDGERADKTVQL